MRYKVCGTKPIWKDLIKNPEAKSYTLIGYYDTKDEADIERIHAKYGGYIRTFIKRIK